MQSGDLTGFSVLVSFCKFNMLNAQVSGSNTTQPGTFTDQLRPRLLSLCPHPYLPRAVTLDQLEVLAQVVVGAEAHFEDLGGPSITGEVRLGVGLRDTLSWTGHLPGQGFAEHLLVHRHGWAGTIISTPFL